MCRLISLVFLFVVVLASASLFRAVQAAEPLMHPAPRIAGQTGAIVNAPSSNFTPAHNRHIDTVVIHFSSAINVDPAHWADAKQVMGIFQKESCLGALS